MSKVVVVGSINQDIIQQLKRVPELGETVFARKTDFAYGGKGANQAVSCQKLGVNCALIAKVGNDVFGKDYLSELCKLGINTEGLIIAENEKTGLATIYVDQLGNNSIVVASNANFSLTTQEVLRNKEVLDKADYILIQNEIPKSVNQAILRIKDKTIIYDPAPTINLDDEDLSNVAIITPNQHEIIEMFKEKLTLDQAATKLLDKGVNKVLITLGAKGVLKYAKDKKLHFPAYRVNPVDSTGAGDSFNGALAAYLAKDYTLEEAISFAQAAAALSTLKLGAQSSMPNEDQISKYIKNHGMIKGIEIS